MREQQPGVLVLERSAAHTFGRDVLLVALQPSIGVGQPVLENALEARLGVALLAVAAVSVFEASFTTAEAVLEEQAREGERGGDDGAAAEGVPERVRVHGRVRRAPPGVVSKRCLVS